MKGYRTYKELLERESERDRNCYAPTKRLNRALMDASYHTQKGGVSYLMIGKKDKDYKWSWDFDKPIITYQDPHLVSLFNDLSSKWKKETAAYSTTLHITRNDNYLDIIGMGQDAVPLILKDLQESPDHWFVALKAITKENPVRKEHLGNIDKMSQDWIDWGKKKKLL